MQEHFSTPMMKQYMEIKKQYPDCLLLYRMGDFYELFLEDAHVGAKLLNITLTGKANGKGGRIPMAGVPYHAVDTYLAKLVKAGHKVAVCEQTSPPNKKGLVTREVVRIVTPGTLMDENALTQKENNFIISLAKAPLGYGLAVADISTGFFATTEITGSDNAQILKDELLRLGPAECIVAESLYNDPATLKLLKTQKNINIYPFTQWNEYSLSAKKLLCEHFGVSTLAGFGLAEKPLAVQACGALLGYLMQTQKGTVGHIKKLKHYTLADHLVLDRSSLINLELFTTIREHDERGTLLKVLDETVTAMGARMLKDWIRKPLVSESAIVLRQHAVQSLVTQFEKRKQLRGLLEQVSDIERLIARLAVGLGNARDMVNLRMSLEVILKLKKHMLALSDPHITQLAGSIMSEGKGSLREIISLIDDVIVSEPPISIREGGMIKEKVSAELDRLRKIINGSRDWILELEKTERERTGISSLKVRFNSVFGFYIEVSKANLANIPPDYMRKQTLVSAERFITPSLKEQEEIILTAEERAHDIEYALFQKTLTKLLATVPVMQAAAASIAEFDCLLNFAQLAQKRGYVCPQIVKDGAIEIINGRHPVVETLLEGKQFVPNTVLLDEDNQLLLITGPNMAGKSVFIRQVALIVLMAQMGSFVPAEKVTMRLVDQIFVRSGASDVITSGMSTFMVEMVETAHILNHATRQSLIIMDEIGRGTSTYDGISIAWAVAEYLVREKHDAPSTLFATHYHELQVLEEKFPRQIRNFHMRVANMSGEPVFLHTITPGGAPFSFGVAVAKLAGIPHEVIQRANGLLIELEKRNKPHETTELASTAPEQEYQQMDLIERLVRKEIEQIDIHQLTPLAALNILASLKEKLKLYAQQKHETHTVD